MRSITVPSPNEKVWIWSLMLPACKKRNYGFDGKDFRRNMPGKQRLIWMEGLEKLSWIVSSLPISGILSRLASDVLMGAELENPLQASKLSGVT
jgi:hypothetical protein